MSVGPLLFALTTSLMQASVPSLCGRLVMNCVSFYVFICSLLEELSVITTTTHYCEHSAVTAVELFSPMGPLLWNFLPVQLRNADITIPVCDF